MKLTAAPLVLGLLLVAGCASTAAPDLGLLGDPKDDLSAAQAVAAVAAHPQVGVIGTFAMEVKGAGRQDGRLYLYSDADYRDPRCLTVAIEPRIEQMLSVRLGGDPASLLKGKKIRVCGTALRVTVWLTTKGVRTDQHYYQTQVAPLEASALVVVAK
ncbi:MAG TPA: hypothetical protein VG838_11015 [Opitutaceae bacterium]|nr:hypothetical protein [Opitutaceae bacterium]